MRQLTSLDAQFLALENDRTQGHVSVLGIYDPSTASGRPLNAALVRELVTERVHLLPTFRWRLASVPFGLDYPYWVDDGTFDVEYHVREIALPSPGNERQLAEQIADLIGRQLHRARPLWEVHVVHGLEDDSVAVLMKMHHAAVDGVSGAEVMSILLDDSAAGRELQPASAVVGEQFPSEVGMLGRGLAGMLRQPLRVLRAAPTTLPHLDDVATVRHLPGVKTIARSGRLIKRLIPAGGGGSALRGNDAVAPQTRFQTRISAHRRVAFGSLSLADVKTIKNAFGCTVNDVVLALCASGLRSWLDEREELPAQPLAGFIPMSVRTPEQRGTFGNRVSVMIAELPTDEADPVKRLRRLNETMKSVKERHSALPASLLLDASHFIPPALFAQAARAMSRLVGVRGINQPANVMISNVPGPSAPMCLGGARQRAQFPVSGVLDGIGINITVMSYQDSLEFGIVVDREQLDDPGPLRDALRVGLDELRDAAKVHAAQSLSDLHSPAGLDQKEGTVMSGQILDGNSMDDYPLTLTSIVGRAERFHADRKVVSRRPSGTITRTTLGDCATRARRLAGALAALGVREGDPVATLLWNQSEHLELYFAVPAMGAVIHTLNPRLFPEELSYIVDDAQDKVIVVDESLLEVFESFSAGREFAHVIVVTHTGDAPAGTLDYESLVAGGEPVDWPALDERRAAAMCYTSGTTGRPKGVVYSHRALVLHSLVAALPDQLAVSARDTILPVVPMFHANAWGLPYAAALAGAALIFPGPHLDPESVLDLCAAERVTMTAGVPTVWMGMLTALDAEPGRWDLSALDRLVVGGAAVPRSMFDGFDRHGLTVVQAWGMTETAPLGTVCRAPASLDESGADEQYGYRARQGVASPFFDIRARDDEGQFIAWDDGAIGELEVRGPWVAASYHRGRGADSFTDDGWFKTGDVVRIDAHGCIRICDRSKDLVKSGGEWISSVDLENHLMAHPAVAQAAVIAVPDDRWGERPLAVICLHADAQTSPAELREHLARDFAKWQLPDRFEFVAAIPCTATGKFKKTSLRNQFAPA